MASPRSVHVRTAQPASTRSYTRLTQVRSPPEPPSEGRVPGSRAGHLTAPESTAGATGTFLGGLDRLLDLAFELGHGQ